MATRLEEERGLAAGISSVPSFVIAGRWLVTGAREPEEYAQMLRRAAVRVAGEVSSG